MRVKEKQIIYLLVYISLFLPFIFFAKDLFGLFMLALINMLFIVFYLVKNKVPWLSLPMLFIILSFIFHCSQIGIILFNIDAELPFNLSIIVPPEIIISSLKYYFLTQYFIGFGYILYFCFNKRNIIANKKRVNSNKNSNLEKMGIVLFFIGLVPTLMIDISKMLLVMGGNYINSYDLYIPRVVSGIAYCFYIGIIIIILANEKNKKKCSKIIFFTFCYIFITMLTGNRASQLSLILFFLFIYFKKINTIKVRNLLLFFIMGYVFLSFIVALTEVRGVTGAKFDLLIEQFYSVLIATPFADFFGELGGTMVSVCYAIQYLPAQSYLFLLYPLICFLGLIPGVSYVLPNIEKSLVFINNFPSYKRAALGGSYVGETYYLFGNYGYIISPFIGIVLMVIHRKITQYLDDGKYYKFSKYAIIYTSMLFYTRDYMINVISNFTIISIILYIVRKIFKYSE